MLLWPCRVLLLGWTSRNVIQEKAILIRNRFEELRLQCLVGICHFAVVALRSSASGYGLVWLLQIVFECAWGHRGSVVQKVLVVFLLIWRRVKLSIGDGGASVAVIVECWLLAEVSVDEVLALVLDAVFDGEAVGVLAAHDASCSKLRRLWRPLGWSLEATCLHRCSGAIMSQFWRVQSLLREGLVLGKNSCLSAMNFEFILGLILKRSQASHAGTCLRLKVELDLACLLCSSFLLRVLKHVNIEASLSIVLVWALLRKFYEWLSVRARPK